MPDIVTLASMITVKGTKGAFVWQSVEDSVDISAFDRLDLQVGFLAQAGDSSTPNGCTVKLYTSMQNTSDIENVWGGLANPVASADFTSSSPAAWKNLIVEADTLALFRYLRWYIDFNTDTAQVTFTIQGMGRRR